MPLIVLMNPYIRHYAGVVLDLPDEFGISGWDEDERVREKINYCDKQCYQLPDDGKGRPALLPVGYTRLCPVDIFDTVDTRSGPCRITSVSSGLSKDLINFVDRTVPEGLGSVALFPSALYKKNRFKVIPENAAVINKVIITDLKTEVRHPIDLIHEENLCMDASILQPGFYRADLLQVDEILHHFTFIKLFPVNVFFSQTDGKIRTEMTTW